jgi:hypothetical protein
MLALSLRSAEPDEPFRECAFSEASSVVMGLVLSSGWVAAQNKSRAAYDNTSTKSTDESLENTKPAARRGLHAF